MKRAQRDLLDPWSEIVGTVVAVNKDSIAIRTTREYTLPIEAPGLRKCAGELKKGLFVGILRTPDRGVRVRVISHRGRMNGEHFLPRGRS